MNLRTAAVATTMQRQRQEHLPAEAHGWSAVARHEASPWRTHEEDEAELTRTMTPGTQVKGASRRAAASRRGRGDRGQCTSARWQRICPGRRAGSVDEDRPWPASSDPASTRSKGGGLFRRAPMKNTMNIGNASQFQSSSGTGPKRADCRAAMHDVGHVQRLMAAGHTKLTETS